MTDREKFEAWLVERDGEETIQKDDQGVYGYWDTRQSFAAWQASRKQALEEAAALCEQIGQGYRDDYRGLKTPINKERCFNPHTDGCSDGAWECEDEIRALANPEGEQV